MSRFLETGAPRYLEDGTTPRSLESGVSDLTWTGSPAFVGVAGTSAAFVGGDITWGGVPPPPPLNFSDNFTGTNSDPWDLVKWPIQLDNTNSPGKTVINANRGEVLNASRAFAISNIEVHDFDMLVKVQWDSLGHYPEIGWRLSSNLIDQRPDKGYCLQLNGNTATLYKIDSYASIGSASCASINANITGWVRVLSVGTSQKVRWWLDGAAEPSTWNLDITDASYVAGHVMLGKYGNVATYFDDVTITDLTPSVLGRAAEFSLDRGGWRAPTLSALFSHDFTISCWANLRDNGGNQSIWGIDNGGSNYFLLYQPSAGQLRVERNSGGGALLGPAGGIEGFGWYYAAVVYTQSTGVVNFYLAPENGAITSTASTTGNGVVSGMTLKVGCDGYSSGIDGSIAAIKVWSEALSAGDIAAEMDEYDPVRSSGLWANWSFYDGPPPIDGLSGNVADESGNGRNLIHINRAWAYWSDGPDIGTTAAASVATVGVAGLSGAFLSGEYPWYGSNATVGVAGESSAFVPGPITWTGSQATVGVAGASGAFASEVTWSGSNAQASIAGTSSAFVPGAVTWSGSAAQASVAGASAAFVPGDATWTGSAAQASIAGTSGAFSSGGAAWAGSNAQASIAGDSGSFTPGAATWSGSAAQASVAGDSGAFAGGPVTWSGSNAQASIAGASAAFVPGAATWSGSQAQASIGGDSGSWSAANAPQTWLGSITSIGIAGASGLFGTDQTWVGSAAQASVAGTSGSFTGGPTTWPGGSAAQASIAGTSGSFVGGATTWTGGSAAQVSIAGTSGAFSGGPVTWSGSLAQASISGASGSFSPGVVTWGGSLAEVSIGASSGAFTPGLATWTGSLARASIAGQSSPFTATISWNGSEAVVSVTFVPGQTWKEDMFWAGSLARVGVAGQSGLLVTTGIIAMWNGQSVVQLQWGAIPVLDAYLEPV